MTDAAHNFDESEPLIWPPEEELARLRASNAVCPQAAELARTVQPGAAILPGLGAGGSLQSVLERRLEQMSKFAHTPEADCEKPLRHLLLILRSSAEAAIEDDQFYPLDRARVRKRAVNVAAMALAVIDRIDFEQAQQP